MSLYEQFALLQRQITDLRREVEAQRLVSKLALLDEDNFASNSATAAASQQSIKAYADGAFGAYTDWTDYTPTWTALTTDPAIGNGTLAGRYCQIGKLVSVKIYMLAGSTTTFGVSNWFIGLPVNSASGERAFGTFWAREEGVSDHVGTCINDYGSAYMSRFMRDGSNLFRWSSAGPFTWADGDYFRIYATYEAA